MLKGTATCEHRDPWWDGWRVTRPFIFQARVSCVDAAPGTYVVTVSEPCAQTASWRQPAKAFLQCVVRRCKLVKLFATRCHHWDLVNPRWTSSEPSWVCHPDHPEDPSVRSWQFWLMGLGGVLGLGVTQANHPSRCMESTSSSSRGLAPDSAIEAIEESRVREWRLRHSMQDDNDFAFAFLDYDQALTQAGRAIAHAWLEARHAALGSMLQQVESTIREVDAKTPSTCRTLQIRPKPRKRPLRLKENQADAPEAVQRRVNALCQVWTEAGALKPSGHLSPEIMASWERSCERLAQKHVTQAEAVTISNAIATFIELRDSMRQRGRSFPPQAIDIDHLLHEKTSAPIRSWNALRWLSKHGSLDWPLSHVSVPTPTRTRKTKGPAVSVSPTMLATLEQHIERRWELNDPAWTGLLSSWVIAAGVMRHRHLERSTLRKITMSFVHFRCSKGKQRRNRGGFAVPAVFTSGWNWSEKWFTLWKTLSLEVQGTCGVCFDAQGIPWPLAESQRLAQEVFFSHVEDIDGLTSYSWRKLMPTVAHTLHVSAEVANALGDWQDASKVDATSKMPLHYSSVRYVESLKSKARCLGALPSLHFESWELIPEEAISEAVEAGTKGSEPADSSGWPCRLGSSNYSHGGGISFCCSSAYQGSRYNVEGTGCERRSGYATCSGGKAGLRFLAGQHFTLCTIPARPLQHLGLQVGPSMFSAFQVWEGVWGEACGKRLPG